MVCIFCLNETKDHVSFHGASELAKQARNVVTKHFWFDANEINSMETYACSHCWAEVESFHDFYGMVESNYPNILNVIDATNNIVNPSKSSPKETKEVKVNEVVEGTDSETERVPTPLGSVDLKEESSESDTLAAESNVNLNAESVINRRNSLKKKEDSHAQTAPPTVPENKNSAKYSCPVCRKPYSARGLRYHMASHDPEEKFILECASCCKKFSRKSHLLVHLKAHRTYKKKTPNEAPCPICQKVMSKPALKNHIFVKHENGKLPIKCVCEVCGKGFSARTSLEKHELTHIDRNLTKVQCGICSKWLRNEYSLREHKKTHKQAAQKCPHCDTMAYNANEMKIHISQFHSEHKHQCSICQKSFIRPIRLREHIAAVHRGERTLDCFYCPKAFKTHSNRFRHMKEVHPREYSLDRERKATK